jgi:hypothetical protein
MKTYVDWYLESGSHVPGNPGPGPGKKIDKKFLEWISKVENKVMLFYGMTLLDLPDENYMDNFKLNTSPERMVDIIFENNKI